MLDVPRLSRVDKALRRREEDAESRVLRGDGGEVVVEAIDVEEKAKDGSSHGRILRVV